MIFCSTVATCRWIDCEIYPCLVDYSDDITVGKGGTGDGTEGDIPGDVDGTNLWEVSGRRNPNCITTGHVWEMATIKCRW